MISSPTQWAPIFRAAHMDRFVQRSRPRASGSGERVDAESPESARPEHHAAKRLKTEDTRDSDEDASSRKSEDDEVPSYADISAGFVTRDDVGESEDPRPPQGTPFESSLPPVSTDKDAIEEYEALRASQIEEEEIAKDTAASRIDSRKWIRGKSSIYVDAFNLALDTVLEEELVLFDDKETVVFEQWRQLSYEAQFL